MSDRLPGAADTKIQGVHDYRVILLHCQVFFLLFIIFNYALSP